MFGGKPSVIKRSMYRGNIMKVSPRPRNSNTADTKRVIMACWVERGRIARASRAPVVAGTMGVTAGSSQTALSALIEWV